MPVILYQAQAVLTTRAHPLRHLGLLASISSALVNRSLGLIISLVPAGIFTVSPEPSSSWRSDFRDTVFSFLPAGTTLPKYEVHHLDTS